MKREAGEEIDFPLMPTFVGSPESVKIQLFVSEMALNMALVTLYENGGLIKGTRVSSTYVKTFLPNFEEVYGKQTDVFMLMEALSAPQIMISESISSASIEGNLRLLNPFNEEFEAVYMRFSIQASIQFELLEDFTLVAALQDAKINVSEF